MKASLFSLFASLLNSKRSRKDRAMFGAIIQQIVLGISLAAPVGPINIEMLKRGIERGFWHAWIVGIGGMTADILFMLLIYFGLSSVFMYTYVQAFMYCAGFFLLFYLGFQSVKQGISHSNMEYKQEEIGGLKQSFMAGFLIAISNPLNLVFWFGIYGSTLSSLLTKVTKQEAFLYSLCIIVGIILWNLNIAFSVHFGRTLLKKKALGYITAGAGIILVGYSIHFAYKALQLFI
ncbi:threonine/homoserine/homoserine lactone efflux protein [Bacillus sp. RC51]|jgi:threonine/homoserine/homoserine lactone efflux protein|uniref:Lysine exporter protein (LYSE/YGGA) n=7 Tax=Bacillus cereus group TaxID=86661 RepID=A9VMK2_BACMK|nr:Lysine exporter protein (LYSE/YGGA) [Bacillus mycoides KBAB4]EEL71596.1 Transporter, LysE [Bacillus mycoides]